MCGGRRPLPFPKLRQFILNEASRHIPGNFKLIQNAEDFILREFETGVNFDDCPHISRLRDNPNLAVQLGVHINSEYSALPQLRAKRFIAKSSSEDLRREQNRRFAMTHVARGAELTRENKCFEAIQVFFLTLTHKLYLFSVSIRH
jgi:hypothetical protein